MEQKRPLRIETPTLPMSINIPEELITAEILHRLPAKSVGRFRCVSKGWRSLLSSRDFIKSHLNFNLRRHPQHILVLRYDGSINILTLNGSPSSSKVIWPLEKEDRFFQLGASCHGLVVVSVGDGFIRFLMNPITGESLRVRKWPIGGVRSMVHGLGYDASTDDYKIVNFSWSLNGTCVDVYSVRMKCWRTLPKPRVGFEPHVPSIHSVNPSVFVNGCIHWLGYADDPRKNVRGTRVGIFAFDLAREEFEEVQPPSSVRLRDEDEYEMKVLGGCLALMLKPYSGLEFRPSADVWLMKEYGVSDSWTKLTINSPEDRSISVGEYKVLSLLNEDDVVLCNGRKFVAYSCRNGVWRHLIDANLSVSMAIGESLESPNYG